jgi:hypothetical protein
MTRSPTGIEAMRARFLRSEARWDVAAGGLYLVVSLWVYANCPASWIAASDGHYSWIYARSLAYDHDLDFTNDYALCGDPMGMGWMTPAHHPANMFYIGPAAFWTPVIWLLKHFVGGSREVAGGCSGVIPAIVLTMSSFAGAVVAWMCAAIARRIVSPKMAALGAVVATLGGHLLFFTGMNPSYSHAYDAMCVALFLYVLLRAREAERPSLGALALAGLLLGLAVLQRSSNCIFGVMAIAALVRSASLDEVRRRAAPVAIVAAVAFATGLLPLLLANRYIYGRFTPFTHGPHFLHFAHAHPWLLVWDLRGGVFAWAPALWLAVPGFVLLARRKELGWLSAGMAVCGLFELYLSSAAIDWQGARRLSNLTPLGALGIALTLERVAAWLRAAPGRLTNVATAAFLSFVVWASGSVCFGYAWGKIPWDVPLTTAQRFGEGEKQALHATEMSVGVLPVLPAAWLFALRYWRPPGAFGWAIHPAWYARDARTLEYQRADFAFAAPEARLLLRGFEWHDDKAPCVKGTEASAVFAAQWPFATRARLTYDASVAQELSVGSRSVLGFFTAWGKASLAPGKRQHTIVPVAPGSFDSGVNEVELRTTGPSESLCVYSLELVDDATYAAAPEAQASPLVHTWHAEKYVEDGASLPSLALGSDDQGAWAVEMHEGARGQLFSTVGRAGALDASYPAGNGFAPRLAAADAGDLVAEVHQARSGPGPLSCRMGQVGWKAGAVELSWGVATSCGNGHHAAVALAGGQAVVLAMSDATSGSLWIRTGSYAPSTWALGEPRTLDAKGFEPSIALGPGGLVLEVHQKEAQAGALVLRAGSLVPGADVVWGEPVEYAEGLAPSVAMAGRTVVEVHQGKDDASQLFSMTGTIGTDGKVTWRAPVKYDTGGHVAFAIDPRSGRAAEAHQGQAAAGSLWMHDGDVYR